MWFPVFFIALCIVTPVLAGSIESNGSTIIIVPGANWKPSDACTIPDRPLSNDPSAIGNYQAKRQKFMDCARTEADGDKQMMQQNLDRSLALIGDDQNDALNEVHQHNRGALNRLGRQ